MLHRISELGDLHQIEATRSVFDGREAMYPSFRIREHWSQSGEAPGLLRGLP